MPTKAKKTSGTKVAVSKKATVAKKTTAKKAVVKKAPAKKVVDKKITASKAVAKKTPVKKATTKKVAVKKAVAEKAPVKIASRNKAVAKKAAPKKSVTKSSMVINKTVNKQTTTTISAEKKPVAKKASVTKSTSAKNVAAINPNIANLGTMGIPPYVMKKDEDYMSEAMRAHFENILLAWKQSLMEEVDRTMTHLRDEAANFPDPNDRASQEEEFSLELRNRDRERKLLKKIESAMQRLRDDEYGYCDACGVDIGVRRLEARPTATLCIDCKTLAEIKEKQLVG